MVECACCHCEYSTNELKPLGFNQDWLCDDCFKYAKSILTIMGRKNE